MKRRQLICGLAVVLVARSDGTLAQSAGRVPQIGMLWPFMGTAARAREALFRRRLAERGYVDGRTVRLEVRSAEGRLDRLAALARDLVALKVDVIVTITVAAAVAARQATRSIPIVMVHAGDPVGAGLIESINHPGGNVTGTTSMLSEIAAKQLQVLLEAVPAARHVAVVLNPSNAGSPPTLRVLTQAAQHFDVKTTVIAVERPEDFEPAFAAVTRSGADALYVGVEGVISSQSQRVIQFAARARIPALYTVTSFVRDGGLLSYSVVLEDHYERAADFVDKILRGAKPADLPVEQPTRFEMAVNLKAANALGITIPPAVLARTDEVIE